MRRRQLFPFSKMSHNRRNPHARLEWEGGMDMYVFAKRTRFDVQPVARELIATANEMVLSFVGQQASGGPAHRLLAHLARLLAHSS
jgi:hypothetical protein